VQTDTAAFTRLIKGAATGKSTEDVSRFNKVGMLALLNWAKFYFFLSSSSFFFFFDRTGV
jgi:hypothetical protein